MEKQDYPEFYNILMDEMLDFLPTEEAKKEFMSSLINWMTIN